MLSWQSVKPQRLGGSRPALVTRMGLVGDATFVHFGKSVEFQVLLGTCFANALPVSCAVSVTVFGPSVAPNRTLSLVPTSGSVTSIDATTPRLPCATGRVFTPELPLIDLPST